MESRFVQSIASQSLGRAWYHRMDTKLAACARHGFRAIEVFMEDLEFEARSLPEQFPSSPAGTSFEASTTWDEQRLAAADYIHQLCIDNRLDVICLQPFMHFAGLLDRQEHDTRINELQFWILLAHRIGTDLIQVPSSFLPASRCTGDFEIVVADLQQIADIGLEYDPPVRFAYEALCWGTHVDKWDDAWKIIEAVDRPNFGTCLDTFNLAGRVYADPTHPCGTTPFAEYDLQQSINKLRSDIDVDKIFYVEVCDGERLDSPLDAHHPWYVEDQKARMTWSRNARLFPFENKGYMPIMDILEAIVDVGYNGYIAFEFFSRTANVAGESVPEDLAIRGEVSYKKIMQHLEKRETSRRGSMKSEHIEAVRAMHEDVQKLARL